MVWFWIGTIGAWLYSLICWAVVQRRWEKIPQRRIAKTWWIGGGVLSIGAGLATFIDFMFRERLDLLTFWLWTLKGFVEGMVFIWWTIFYGLALWLAPFIYQGRSMGEKLAIEASKHQWVWLLGACIWLLLHVVWAVWLNP